MFINSKLKIKNSNQIQNPKSKPFSMEERTAQFGEVIIDLLKKVPDSYINRPLIDQLIRSATSVGANFMEATAASSRKDFFNKVSIACKEAKETKHWIRMIARANPQISTECRPLWQETHESISQNSLV
jgi:four helix bundle protein